MKKILLYFILSTLFVTHIFAKGEVTDIYAHYEDAVSSSYTVDFLKHRWGEGKNLIIDGFDYAGKKYEYTTLAKRVVIRRADNDHANGDTCGLFVQKYNNTWYQKYKYEPTYPSQCDMASVMGGRTINVGALDLFKNEDGGSASEKNIERVDFITDSGIKAPNDSANLAKAGHVVTEKSGNNPIQIAAIKKLDSYGNPSEYGPLVKILGGGTHNYGMTTIHLPDGDEITKQRLAFLNKDKDGNDEYPHRTDDSYEQMGMSFVSLEDLGIEAGEMYYGFSLFGRDVTSDMDLVDYDSFPKDTSGDTADPYGGVAGYFMDEEIVSSEPVDGLCYAMSDNENSFFTVSMSPGANPLPIPVETTLDRKFNGEGSAYRAIDNKLYVFQAVSDSTGPSDLYSIDVADGTITPVKEDLLDGSVDGAEFYYDVELKQEIFYVISGESHSKLYAFDSSTWELLDGYPLSLSGDTTGVSSIAIDPLTGDAYGIDDYNYDKKKPKLYQIDLATGKTTFKVQLDEIADAEGLAYASDGNLYIEDESYIDGRKIYKVDLTDGSLIPSAVLGGSSDIEGLSCNGTEITEDKMLLISEYHFDECQYNGTNLEVKDTQNSVDAVAVNGATTTYNGKIKRSAHFNGKNYIDMGDSFNDIFGETSDKFTITAWIKPTELTDDKTNHNTKNTFIAKASDSKNDNIELGVNPDGSLHVYLDTKAKDKYADIGSGITSDSWHFIAVSYDGNSVAVQIDDQKFESTVWNGGGNIDKANGSPFTIGATLHVNNYFKGDIDEVKIYNGVLDDDKLQTIYSSEKDDNGNDREVDTCLIGEYRFDACDWFIGDVKDSVGENDAIASEEVISSENAIIEHSAQLNEALIKAEYDYSFVNDTFSISFWMKLNRLPEKQYMSVLGKDLELYVRNDGKLSINLNNGSSNLVSSDSIKANEWKYITISSDSKVLKLFIDAKESGSIDAEDLGKDGNPDLVIGKIDSNTLLSNITVEDFDGYVDELKIFDNKLDEQQIKDIIKIDNEGKNYDGSQREALLCLEPVGCTSKAIVIDDTKYVHQIDLVTGDKNTTIMSEEQVNEVSVNGFGYNIKDGFLWGSSNRSYYGYLVKIGKDKNGEFAQTRVGPIEGLPTNKGTYIGDVNNDGQLYLYYKNTPESGVHTIYIINLDRDKPNYLKVVDSFTLPNIVIADMSFNPIDKQLYAIESDNDLYKIDVENKSARMIKKDAVDEGTDTFGSSFFDSQGFFYAIKNTSRNVYRIDISDEENIRSLIFSTLINEDVQNVNIDGGRCNLKPIYIDYGDAPDSSSYSTGDGTGELNYKTLTSDDGPRHSLPIDENSTNVYLGESVSSESDAKSASYENVHDYDDDNGLVDGLRPLYNSMRTYSIKVKVTNDTNLSANLVGWIDFNRNGRFETKEGVKSIVNGNLSETVTLKWDIPDDIDIGVTFARFRVTTDELDIDESYSYGAKRDGEVEDYKITIKEGSFYDAWGIVEGSIDHPVIHTKIVKETIALKTVSLNKERTQEIDHSFKDVKIGLFDKNGTVISSFVDINTSSPHDIVYFNINKPYRYVYAHFTYKDEDNITHESNATDPFSIRPKNFVIKAQKDINDTYFRAGKDFDFDIKVEDYDGNYIDNFDVNTTTFELDYNETKESTGCIRGELDFNTTNFVNGESKFKASYSEVGELNFKVKEVLGKEFAIVDKDDGSGDHRFIDEDDDSERFHPYSLKAIYNYNSINNKDYTYYSSDPVVMGVILDLNVSVINENNETVHNFTDGCYNDDVNIRIDYQRWGNVELPIFVNSSDGLDANVTNNGNNHAGAIQYAIDENTFLNGTSSRSISMNFNRAINIPKAPLKFKLTTTKTEIWPSSITVNGSVDKTISFIYARAHAPKEQSIVGDTIDAIVDYEVYLPVGVVGSDFGLPNGLVDSADDIHWYKLPYDGVFGYKFGTTPELRFAAGATIGAVTPTSITITANSTPYTNRVVYTPKDFLLHNRFNPSATTDSFRINLNNVNTTWNGKGKQGNTVDDQVSNRGLKKMDW